MNPDQTNTTPVSLSIELFNDAQLSEEDLDRMTRLIRNEIEEQDNIQSIQMQLSEQPTPEGSKAAGEAVTIGMLVLQVLPAAIPALIGYLKDWSLRPGNPPVKIKTQVKGNSIEVEFDPRVSSAEDIASQAQNYLTMLTEKNK